MKHFVFILAFCFSFIKIMFAQDPNKDLIPTLKTVYVGDTVPNLFLRGFYHSPSSGEYLSSLYKNKLLILDFWQTHCGSCIAAFPRIEKLEEKFGSRLQVLEVTDNSEKVVMDFFRKQEKSLGRRYNTAGIFGDSLLYRIFPHESIPHCIWINQFGKVIAITAGSEVNEENISAILDGRSVSLPLKDDSIPLKFHDITKPLFINGNGGDGKGIIWYSVLSKYVRGLQNVAGLSYNDSTNTSSVDEPNTSILNLYKVAFEDDPELRDLRLSQSRIHFEMDSSQFSGDSAGRLLVNRLYSYSMVCPRMEYTDVKRLMQSDLQRYFGFDTKWQRKKMKCLVLTIGDTNQIKATKRDFSDEEFINSNNDFGFISMNNPLKYFRLALAESYLYYSPYPIIDETGYKGFAYFQIEADMSDWKAIDKALSAYTMHLTLQDREVNVLVVSKPNHDRSTSLSSQQMDSP